MGAGTAPGIGTDPVALAPDCMGVDSEPLDSRKGSSRFRNLPGEETLGHSPLAIQRDRFMGIATHAGIVTNGMAEVF